MTELTSLIAQCKTLKLDGFIPLLEQGNIEAMSNETLLTELLTAQIAKNKARKIKRLVTQAKLRYTNDYIADIEYELYPSLKVNQVNQLTTCQWLENKQNLIVLGATGTGKTSLACRFAQEAIAHERSVLFYRLSHLLLALLAADKEGELMKLIKRLGRPDLLILDDWGNALMDRNERHLLFELIEYREEKGSLLITSQYPIKAWHETFGNETIADSVLDRIVHKSHKIELSGESIRKLLSTTEGGEL
ncbi:IS21-like element helper ATPase IstB [Endozoicomonas sp. G2_1]|uniref:IS21-like element helper ATPase IstB n=1 Tax=Endozoicomonas sp. G2_1 TaxID=2821091 RepID=UPI001ADAA355|nr:IS21-like element helper ATPase IstB [Endozoicomonas sp. G2_1]MBO9492023.1 IS21-like element helper ATPase IstB [Endozoicomonas sp. G2_1]